MVEERKIASGSYFLTFLGDMESLLNYSAGYINLLITFKNKYPADALKKGEIELDEKDQQSLRNIINIIRGLVFKTYIRFNALKDDIEEFKKYENKLTEKYNKIMGDKVPERKDIEDYTTTLNKLFVSSSISEILSRSKKILEGLTK